MEELFLANQNLVRYVYNRWFFNKYPSWKEDILQEGYLALWRCCMGYDPEKETRFSTYAIPAIYRQMLSFTVRVIQKHQYTLSLDRTVVSENSEGDSMLLIDTLSEIPDCESKFLIEICMQKLCKQDQKIIRDLFRGYTQNEISEKYSISQPTVSRKLNHFKNLVDQEKINNA